MNMPDEPQGSLAPSPVGSAAWKQRAAETRARTKTEKEKLAPVRAAADARILKIGTMLSEPTRWRILLELGKGAALPMEELAKRTGRSVPVISRNLAQLRAAGLVESVYTTCYQLPAAMQAAPGATVIDLGPCLLKLEVPQ